MARLVTQLRRFPSTGGEVVEVVGSTPPMAVISLLLVPDGRVDSVTPIMQGGWPWLLTWLTVPGWRITEGLESGGPLVGT